MSPLRRVGVVGAGIAGLACSLELARAGLSVTVFDKGRRPGGRVASRQLQGVDFNHGAQFATARTDGFARLLDACVEAGIAAEWPAAGSGRWSFVPDMAALPRHLAAQIVQQAGTLHVFRQVGAIEGRARFWQLRHFAADALRPGEVSHEGGELTSALDAVLLALPPSQAAVLLADLIPDFAAIATASGMAPCWAVMARFPAPVGGPDVLEGEGVLAWAAREGSRPGNRCASEAWTLHAAPEWSREHLESPPSEVESVLLAAFQARTGASQPMQVASHRWKFAKVEVAAGLPHLWDAQQRIGACGDWCLGGRVEAAYTSGLSLAHAVLASGGRSPARAGS